MPKLSLIDIVQDILNDLDGDEVNSISDTVESEQVANIVKSTFYEIIDSRDWPHLGQLIQLTPTITYPTQFTIDDDFNTIEWIKYNVRDADDTYDKFTDVLYMTPKEFIDMLNSRKSSDSDTDTMTIDGIKYFVKNDHYPQYWTSFDDETIIMDAYDSAVDSNLQASKVQCWGYVHPAWSMTDAHVPDLPAKAFSYLVSEAKSTAFNSLRQIANAKEEQKSKRQRQKLSRDKWKANGGMTFPDYGRK